MAKPPIVCPTYTTETAYFDRCTFNVSDGTNAINTFNFCNYSLAIDDFFTQATRLRGGSEFLIDDAEIGNLYGEAKFIFIKVEYSSAFIKDSDRYINLLYGGSTYPIGELHIWTGEPGISAGLGINITPSKGGIALYNPHTGSVDIKIIIASSLTDQVTNDELFTYGSENGLNGPDNTFEGYNY